MHYLFRFAVCIRGCLSCFWALRFLCELRLFALINEYLEHAHQFVSVNMAVSSCQVVLFWFLVSGMAIIKKDSSAVLLCCEGYALQCFYYPEHV